MPKNVLHDVMTRENRSIRQVPLPDGRRGRREVPLEEDILYEQEEFTAEEGSSFSWRRMFLWGIAALFLILLGVALATSFTGATFSVTPKTELVLLNSEFVASEDVSADLHIATVAFVESAEIAIPATATKKLSERAGGTIVIYNNYTEQPQRLIKNTRFETPRGLIYRIGNSITIPGKTTQGGKIVPGSIEVSVTADSPGEEYNISLSDFTIPGFKNDPGRFSGFYARSKAPMTGGFEGTLNVPTDAALEAARASLRSGLNGKVAARAQENIPDGFVLFNEAQRIDFESLPLQNQSEGAMALVRERAGVTAYLLKEGELAAAIAEETLSSYGGQPVRIPEMASLEFKLLETPAASEGEAQSIRFSLKGNARIVWLFDEQRLKEALAGQPKDELASILAAFPTIAKVELVLRPFWSQKFPGNVRKISIEGEGN